MAGLGRSGPMQHCIGRVAFQPETRVGFHSDRRNLVSRSWSCTSEARGRPFRSQGGPDSSMGSGCIRPVVYEGSARAKNLDIFPLDGAIFYLLFPVSLYFAESFIKTRRTFFIDCSLGRYPSRQRFMDPMFALQRGILHSQPYRLSTSQKTQFVSKLVRWYTRLTFGT